MKQTRWTFFEAFGGFISSFSTYTIKTYHLFTYKRSLFEVIKKVK